MSEEKEQLYEWDFSVPVSGYENFSIIAKTFDEDLVEDFIETDPNPGSFISLADGDIVFRTRR